MPHWHGAKSLRNAQINNAIALSLSADRLNKYLLACGSDLDLAIGLYERNTRLSEAFYTPLQALEICLRNKLDRVLQAAFGADWMNNGNPPLQHFAQQSIQRAIADLRQGRHPITPGAIVAELHFGFWVSLVGPKYDQDLWRQACFRAFSSNGRSLARNLVHGRLNALRRFRNRVAHHEPIFHRPLKDVHDEVIEAIGWICPDSAAWAVHHSRLPAVLAAP